MDGRHEFKHALNHADYLLLRSRLRAALPHDAHVNAQGEYAVRSLYFDTPSDRALREKIDGVNHRDKFRIRCYNGSPSFLRLERKSKHNGLCYKASACVTADETRALLRGDLAWMKGRDDPLVLELYARMTGQLLRPRTIVDYVREPFVYAPGNVRITLDRDVHTGLSSVDFFAREVVTAPVGDTRALMEVKYDAFLPGWIGDLVQIGSRPAAAFSKYALCRVYG